MTQHNVQLPIVAGARWADMPVAPGLQAGISLLPAGNMSFSRRHDLTSRGELFSELGIGENRVYGLRQVHSTTVVSVDGLSPDSLSRLEADGMVTRRLDAVLTVTVADCLPVFLADTARNVFALVHSGWKGTGIVRDALSSMKELYGTNPGDVSITIGPGIGACCYRVPEERAAGFAARFGPESIARGADGAPRLDLRQANISLLRAAGVREVVVVGDCTGCGERFGSFRRQGPESFALMLAWVRRM